MTNECVVDGRPAPSALLCAGCLDQLKTELRALLPHDELRNGQPQAVPGLLSELDITLSRQARIGDRSGPRPTETPLPFNLGASIDLETLRDGLAMWARAVAEQRGITVDSDGSAADTTRWLLRWAGELAQHEDAGDLYGDVIAMIRAARRTIDRAPERRYVGPCDHCQADLYVPALGSGYPETVVCPTPDCGAQYAMSERRLWLLEQAYDRLLTAAEMSRAIRELIPGRELTPNVISQWASRGLSTPDGRITLTPYLPMPGDPHKRQRYLVGEVIEFARRALDARTRKAG